MRHQLTNARLFISRILMFTGLIGLLTLPADAGSKAPWPDLPLPANAAENHQLLKSAHLSSQASSELALPAVISRHASGGEGRLKPKRRRSECVSFVAELDRYFNQRSTCTFRKWN